MKKSILNTTAFRYIFEVIVIVFSVTLSFYIQDVLNEREKIHLKNNGLDGVLIELAADKRHFLMGISLKEIINDNTDSILTDGVRVTNENIFWTMRRYFNFQGSDKNFNSMVSTGSIEFIESKELSIAIQNYYGSTYELLRDFSYQDRNYFDDMVDYLGNNYLVKSSEFITVLNDTKNDSMKLKSLIYDSKSLLEMKSDRIIISKLYHKQWMSNFYKNLMKSSLKKNENLVLLIKKELNN